MRSIAFDQSGSVTAWSVMQDNLVIDYGYFDTSEETFYPEKISEIKKQIKELINIFRPEDNQEYIIAVENIQYQTNVETYKLLSAILGVLENYFYENGIDYVIIPPTVWRSTCNLGTGKREVLKKRTQEFIKSKYGIVATEDECDSLAINHHIHTKYKKQQQKKIGK